MDTRVKSEETRDGAEPASPFSGDDEQELAGLDGNEIASLLGIQAFQGRQIFRWIHQKYETDFDAMSDISKDLRRKLKDGYLARRLSLVNTSTSAASKTKKVVLGLPDGETIEAVLISHRDRVTLCLSTQAGCAVNCSFCATGLSGFARNLSPAEIAEQALFLLSGENIGRRTPNIVYMGMGEPFRNYDATMKSVRLLMDPEGLGVGARKITVSTAGDVPGIERFSHENWQVRLSISLHAANDELRNELVPLNRKYGLDRLLEAAKAYRVETGRHLTFEWALLAGVNDSPKDVQEIVERTGDLQPFVNLIPYNTVPGLSYKAPSLRHCGAFRDALVARGIKATLRVERGGDIDAACGQLRRRVTA